MPWKNRHRTFYTAMKKKRTKKPMFWFYKLPPYPTRRGSAHYYWYVSGVGKRLDVMIFGLSAEDNSPFIASIFQDFDVKPEDLDGFWLGPIQLPRVNEQKYSVDWLRESRRKK